MDEVRTDRLIAVHGRNTLLVIIRDWPISEKYRDKPELIASLEYLVCIDKVCDGSIDSFGTGFIYKCIYGMVKTSCLPKTLKCQILCGFHWHKATTSIVTPHLLLLYMGCWPMAGSTFQNFVRYLWCSSLPAIICFPKQRETPPEGKLSFSRTQHLIMQGGL